MPPGPSADASDDEGGADEGPAAGKRDRGAPYPKIWHTQNPVTLRWSYLRISQTRGGAHKTLRAVCAWHHNCTLTKSCRRNRPLGSLWSWLNSQSYDFLVSREDHKLFIPTWEERAAARLELLDIRDIDEFCEAECPKTSPEDPDEPEEWLGPVE